MKYINKKLIIFSIRFAIVHNNSVFLQIYCNIFLKMEKYSNLGKWVEDLPKRGKRVFSKQEVEDQFSRMSYYNLRNSLN